MGLLLLSRAKSVALFLIVQMKEEAQDNLPSEDLKREARRPDFVLDRGQRTKGHENREEIAITKETSLTRIMVRNEGNC
nr:PREDICTED: uncharacterized protein LOC108213259 isoform X2 [Daucus carota subsp. sativus]